jgi:tight adherence protein C
MNSVLLPVVVALMSAAAVLVLGLSIAGHRSTAGVRRSLALVQDSGLPRLMDGESPDAPSSWGREALVALTRILVLPVNRRWIRRQLTRAGRVRPEDAQRVLDQKVVLAFTGLLLGALAVQAFGAAGWLMLLGALAVGYLLPDLLVYNAGLRRTEEIRLGLPDALDLLDLCVESGLSLQSAMGRVAQAQEGPVAEEFARVLQEMRLGVARSAALQSLVDRATESDLKQLVSAIMQAESLGIPIAAVLREQAREMRAKRTARAREAAQKVPVKILAPLMLCFLPGLFIIILGPAAIAAFEWFMS